MKHWYYFILKITLIIECIFHTLFINVASAQISPTDSLFLNATATEQVWISYWNYPGKWFIRPEVSSVNNFYEQALEEYPFNTHEFANAYTDIVTNSTLLPDSTINQSIDSLESNTPITLFGLNNPFRVLPFQLNGNNGMARALLDSTHNNGQHQVAYMVILGSGTNIIKQFFDNLGYHNTNCATMNYLRTRGDVYIMTTPNEEMRAIYFNKKKMRSATTPSFLLNYLNANNRAPGITRLIEYLAMIKYLKNHYDKVIVLGLSTGGKVAHWVSLAAEPDAALISSGYSVLVDNDFNSQNVNAVFYGPYQTIFTKDSLKNRIKQVHTEFLFTLAQNDSPIAQLDIDSGYTKTFYQDVNNTSFFYNYTNHAFPPCMNMDTFFTRCISKPKVKIYKVDSVCIKDSMRILMHFIGQAPFNANLYYNGNILYNFLVSNNDTILPLYNSGKYWIDQISDIGPMQGYRSDTIHYKPTLPLNANWTNHAYNCDSNKQAFTLNINGESPFVVNYLKNGQLQNHLQDTTKHLWLENGLYTNTSIIDNAKCQLLLTDSLNLNYTPISISPINPIYDCDSNKRRIQFNVLGNGPWVMSYSKNGQWFQDTFLQANNTRYYDNGLYQFASLSDATGCSTNINQSYNFNDQVLSWNLNQQQYDCDSNLYHVQFAVQGNAPFNIHYELVGGFSFTKTYHSNIIDLYLPNGQWMIQQISDTTGCSKNINLSYNVSFQAISASSALSVYDCDSNKMRIEYTLQGNAPFTFTLNQLNTNSTQWLNSNSFAPKFWLNQGQYLMQEVSDATGCKMNINQYIQHNIQILNYQILPRTFDCDSNQVKYPIHLQGNAPWIISYRNLNNGILYTKSSQQANTALSLSTGTYVIENIADAYCNTNSNDTLLVNFPALQVQVNTPDILCDSGKAAIGVNFQSGLLPAYLTWVYNGTPDSVLLHNGLQTILMPNGTYFIQHIRDSANCLQPIGSTYNANYIPLMWHGINHNYNCPKDSSDIEIQYSGALQTGMYFTRNNIADTLYLKNNTHQTLWHRGNYHIAYLRDSANCIFTVDTQFVIKDVPISFSTNNIQPDCSLNEYVFKFNLEGSSPWELSYINKNQMAKIMLTDTNTFLNLPSGAYTFYEIKDQNGCIRTLQEIHHLPNFLSDSLKLERNGSELIVETKQFPIQWEWNGQMLDSSFNNKHYIPILGEGLYRALITDSALCSHWTNSIQIQFENEIFIYPNPTLGLIYLAFPGNIAKPYELVMYNMHGEKLKSWRSFSLHHKIDILDFPIGLYYLKIIEDGTNKTQIIKIIKE